MSTAYLHCQVKHDDDGGRSYEGISFWVCGTSECSKEERRSRAVGGGIEFKVYTTQMYSSRGYNILAKFKRKGSATESRRPRRTVKVSHQNTISLSSELDIWSLHEQSYK
ncbi:hypothetical protein Trydic_g11039 [Trypoxylus dichotomus]